MLRLTSTFWLAALGVLLSVASPITAVATSTANYHGCQLVQFPSGSALLDQSENIKIARLLAYLRSLDVGAIVITAWSDDEIAAHDLVKNRARTLSRIFLNAGIRQDTVVAEIKTDARRSRTSNQRSTKAAPPELAAAAVEYAGACRDGYSDVCEAGLSRFPACENPPGRTLAVLRNDDLSHSPSSPDRAELYVFRYDVPDELPVATMVFDGKNGRDLGIIRPGEILRAYLSPGEHHISLYSTKNPGTPMDQRAQTSTRVVRLNPGARHYMLVRVTDATKPNLEEVKDADTVVLRDLRS